MVNNVFKLNLALATATSLGVMLASSNAMAATFNVNRSWSQFPDTASLVGTVDVPLGSYTIQNGTPNPFTSVNLTLTLNGTPFALNTAITSSINGTGQFFVNANSSTLTFNTANADGTNPADLAFQGSGATYAIGSDGAPGFEVGLYPSTGTFIASSVSFGANPVVFGTAGSASVPEPSPVLGLLGLGLLGLASTTRKKA